MQNSVFERFKRIRKKLGKNQIEFARNLGTNQQGISDIERGIKNLSPEIIEYLGNNYNINLNWLIAGKEKMFNEDISGNNIVEEDAVEYNINNSYESGNSNFMKKEIDYLKKQLEEKDKQIKEKDNQINDLLQILKK